MLWIATFGRLVGKQCSSADSAQDAVQDALLAAATHLGDFRGDGSLEGWLSRMVTNACRRMQRGRKADASLHEEFGDEHAALLSGPEEESINQGLGEQLRCRASNIATTGSSDRASGRSKRLAGAQKSQNRLALRRAKSGRV